jgi:membrane-associated protease RseP (regulator of RpoE activity)
MLSPFRAAASAIRLPSLPSMRRRRLDRVRLFSFGRRLAYFWLVWTGLLLVHEGGHAFMARRVGVTVRRVTVGMGPVLWRGQLADTRLVLRLVPLAGVTAIDSPLATTGSSSRREAASPPHRWDDWRREVAMLAAGIAATLLLATGIAALVVARERLTTTRWCLGRMLVADALVLTVFNFLPVPPLDGGRAALGAIAAVRDAPLAGDTLFWVQLGGLALAVVPMALWTRWTARIDALAMRWRAPGKE